MRKIILISLFLVVVCMLTAAEPIAILLQGKGNVQLTRNKKNVKYKSGELLYNDDVIRTAGESFAAVKYTDGQATVKVFPNSIITITAQHKNNGLAKNTKVQQGSLYSKVNGRIKGTYQVETPTTVASVKWTGYITRYTPQKVTEVIVFEGEVLVEHKESGKSQSATVGTTARSTFKGEVTLESTSADELSSAERQAVEETNSEAQKTMKIQITDENGNLKYIEITY